MSWVEIHDEILGSKLRGLRKKLNCSEAKAVGILAILWLWASKNVDDEGRLANTDEDDISNALRQYVGEDSPKEITAALIESGWIDNVDGMLMIHDWYEWQKDSIAIACRRRNDRARQQKHRMKQVEKPNLKATEAQIQDKPEQKSKPTKKPKEPKVKFAEYVQLTQAEYDKLIDEYGEPYTKKLIETLDNYKGSSGKKYASDYRAILNWVVERCDQKYASLKKGKVQDSSIDMSLVDQLINRF